MALLNRYIFQPASLTLRQRIVRGLVIFGLPTTLLDILFYDASLDWIVAIPIALFGGIIAGVCYGLTEHAVVALIKRKGWDKRDR